MRKKDFLDRDCVWVKKVKKRRTQNGTEPTCKEKRNIFGTKKDGDKISRMKYCLTKIMLRYDSQTVLGWEH